MSARGVALGGFMGVGKTTVGAALAGRLGLPFVDLDARVEAAAGRSAAEIFARDGEPAFRAAEAVALAEVAAGPLCVVALGGGTLHARLAYAAKEALKERFDLFILHAAWEALAPRLHALPGRPLAAQGLALYQAREAGYRAAGPLVDVTGLTVAQAVDRLVAAREAACR